MGTLIFLISLFVISLKLVQYWEKLDAKTRQL